MLSRWLVCTCCPTWAHFSRATIQAPFPLVETEYARSRLHASYTARKFFLPCHTLGSLRVYVTLRLSLTTYLLHILLTACATRWSPWQPSPCSSGNKFWLRAHAPLHPYQPSFWDAVCEHSTYSLHLAFSSFQSSTVACRSRVCAKRICEPCSCRRFSCLESAFIWPWPLWQLLYFSSCSSTPTRWEIGQSSGLPWTRLSGSSRLRETSKNGEYDCG